MYQHVTYALCVLVSSNGRYCLVIVKNSQVDYA